GYAWCYTGGPIVRAARRRSVFRTPLAGPPNPAAGASPDRAGLPQRSRRRPAPPGGAPPALPGSATGRRRRGRAERSRTAAGATGSIPPVAARVRNHFPRAGFPTLESEAAGPPPAARPPPDPAIAHHPVATGGNAGPRPGAAGHPPPDTDEQPAL